MDVSVFTPYIISIVVTLMYASLGKFSSGESFDAKKFLETLGVQIVALLGVALAGAPAELIAALPTVVTVLLMKAYSYFKKKKDGLI